MMQATLIYLFTIVHIIHNNVFILVAPALPFSTYTWEILLGGGGGKCSIFREY